MFATPQKPRLGRRRSSIPIIDSQPCSVITKAPRVKRGSRVSPSEGNAPIPTKLELFRVPRQLLQLACSDQIIIRERKESQSQKLSHGYEVESRYDIFNEYDHLIYTAEESSEISDSECMGSWCGALNLVVKIKEPHGKTVIRLECPLPLQEICWLQSMDVRFASGKRIGKIKQYSGHRAHLLVMNDQGETDFVVKGPPRHFSWRHENIEFSIYESDGETECGRVSKRWGFLHRAFNFPQSDNFGVKFPPGIGPTMKCLFIGAAFLVDYMYLNGKCNGGPQDKFSPFDFLHRNVILHGDADDHS